MASWQGEGSASFRDTLGGGPAHQAIRQAESLENATQGFASELDDILREGFTSDVEPLVTKMQALLRNFETKLDQISFKMLKNSIAELVKVVNQHEKKLEQQTMKTDELKQEVEELKRLIAGYEERRATLVGGQLACNLDDIVCRMVLGPGCVMSLGKLKKYIEDGADVTDEQRRKWDAVVRFLQRRSGASLQQLIAALRPLRDQRYPAAHGTHEEHDISTAELSDWAQKQNPAVSAAVGKLLTILEPLTKRDKPLRPLAARVIEEVIIEVA